MRWDVQVGALTHLKAADSLGEATHLRNESTPCYGLSYNSPYSPPHNKIILDEEEESNLVNPHTIWRRVDRDSIIEGFTDRAYSSRPSDLGDVPAAAELAREVLLVGVCAKWLA